MFCQIINCSPISYRLLGSRPSIDLRGLKSGFSIGLTGVHLSQLLSQLLAEVPIVDNNWQAVCLYRLLLLFSS